MPPFEKTSRYFSKYGPPHPQYYPFPLGPTESEMRSGLIGSLLSDYDRIDAHAVAEIADQAAGGQVPSTRDVPSWPESVIASPPARNFGQRVLDSFVQAGNDAWTGYRQGAAGMYQTAGGLLGLFNDTNDWLTRKTGIGALSDDTIFGTAEQWLRDTAQRVAPRPEKLPRYVTQMRDQWLW